jgi:hypothetical protein
MDYPEVSSDRTEVETVSARLERLKGSVDFRVRQWCPFAFGKRVPCNPLGKAAGTPMANAVPPMK